MATPLFTFLAWSLWRMAGSVAVHIQRMSCGPPCPPCAPPPPPPCPQICTPPPPPAPCRHKPLMRGLHWAQTTRNITIAIISSTAAALTYYALISVPRHQAYKDYYSKAEFDDQAEDMAKMGLMQAIKPGSK